MDLKDKKPSIPQSAAITLKNPKIVAPHFNQAATITSATIYVANVATNGMDAQDVVFDAKNVYRVYARIH